MQIDKDYDFEMLRLAAIAVGVKGSRDSDGGFCWIAGEGVGLYCAKWNPLRYDRDAFKLMIDLKMQVAVELETTFVTYSINGGEDIVDIDHGEDPYIAVRYAIVRAAAWIGEKTEKAK